MHKGALVSPSSTYICIAELVSFVMHTHMHMQFLLPATTNQRPSTAQSMLCAAET